MSNASHPLSRLAAAMVVAACLTPAAGVAVAADGETDVEAAEAPIAAGFQWRPQVGLTPMYDDNIYALPTGEIADWVWILSPTVSGESQWDRHRIRLDAGAELGRHDAYDSEDYDEWWVNADGRWDLAAGSHLFGGLGWSQEHEERGSPDAVAPTAVLEAIEAEPTVYRALTAQGGVVHRFGDSQLRTGVTYERLSYDDVPSLAGPTLNNDDRDREVLGVALRLSHPIDDGLDLFAQALWNQRRYADSPDDFGYYRDSDGYRLAVGLKGKLARGIEAEGYVGYLSQDYDDPGFDRVAGLDFAGKLNWWVAPPTRVRLTLERNVHETTLEGSSSYLHTNLAGSISHQLGERTTLNANLGGGLVAYQDVGREDWIYSAGLSAQYALGRHLYLTGGYRWVRRDSNDGRDATGLDLYDYDRQQVFLTLTLLGNP